MRKRLENLVPGQITQSGELLIFAQRFRSQLRNRRDAVERLGFIRRAQDAGLSAEPVASVANALKLLRDTWDDSEAPPRILIGGSLYLVGEAREALGLEPA